MSNNPSTFNALGVPLSLAAVLAEAGFREPTPIQAAAIPAGLQGRDVLGCAQTGTGKTAAFVVPMIHRLAGLHHEHPKGLILVPTRELAFQIQRTLDQLGRKHNVSSTTIVGGSDMHAQIRALRQRPTILVSTPGRLLDHLWQGTVHLSSLCMVVLDEADRMLDMGFAPQLSQILEALPEERQTMLFSATMPTDLGDLARISVKHPMRAMMTTRVKPAEGITHTLHRTTALEKTPLLLSLLKTGGESVLVFTKTKHRANRLGDTLGRVGYRVAVLHGGHRLPQRRRALEGFRCGRYRILVATDVAARGLDIAHIGQVINYDLPMVPEDYVHRIGRTGRMKKAGTATSFVTRDDGHLLRAIERYLGQSIPSADASQPAASCQARTHHVEGRASSGERSNDRAQCRRFRQQRTPRSQSSSVRG
ncbi:MAG: DEAD/DEAH box helicase [Nitrospirae bacterium]|nr:MAG: DEAD/DEAH box helicase [Nitrospirota bacterium]